MTEREYQEIQARLRTMRGEKHYATANRAFGFRHRERSLARPISKWWYFVAGVGLGLILAVGASADAASPAPAPVGKLVCHPGASS